MLIRIKPGEAFSKSVTDMPDRKYKQVLPLTIEASFITVLREHLDPIEWYVYCALLFYEHCKFEMKTPDLIDIYRLNCKNLFREQFDKAITSLQATKVRLDDGTVQPLVLFVCERDLSED
jgi:hypothetical protein